MSGTSFAFCVCAANEAWFVNEREMSDFMGDSIEWLGKCHNVFPPLSNAVH